MPKSDEPMPGAAAGVRSGAEWVDFGHLSVARLADACRAERTGEPRSDDVDASWAGARERFVASLDDENAFAVLVSNASLTVAEAEVLAVAVACEIDGRRQRLVAYIQEESGASRISLDTVNRLFDPGHRGALVVGPDATMRRAAFVGVITDGPWSDHRLVVHQTVVWALLGDGGRDPDLPGDLTVVATTESAGAALVVVSGTDVLRRRQVAADAALGTRFVATRGLDGDETWAAIVREATIAGCGVIVELDGDLSPTGQRWIDRANHLTWAISSRLELPVGQLPDRPWVAVEAGSEEPTDDEWQAVLGDAPRAHRLNLDQLDIVGRAYDAYGGDLDAAVRRLVSGKLERLARRIRPRHAWDDIVLSSDRTAVLRSIVDRYRHADQVYGTWGFPATPSRGLVALFSGPSGTGKTLAAEIVAGELGLDVFKLDLSAVVSKYIGETEKNLEEVFNAASAGNLLLFFDEADSLFGKRSEVKDARDRYANIEVSYLLQRLEAYDGLVVMATNFERNVDEAFLRRIHTRIEFVLPGVPERQTIWERNLPTIAPVEGVDTAWLAQHFELSGAAIRNAAVHAAFVAAAEGSPVTMDCAVVGVASEMRKLGRLVKAEQFGQYSDVIRHRIGQ
jgi:AAA+ superfamily predicted ATPase